MDNKLFSDFVATAYKDGSVDSAFNKFPELQSYGKQLLSDFVATAYKYGDVKGKDVILVDDMVDTAGTLVKAAEVLKEKGANSVMACCTHGVLSGPAYERVANGVLDELVISDTIPTKKNAKKITVLTASSIIGEAIRRIHNNESVNSIFNN